MIARGPVSTQRWGDRQGGAEHAGTGPAAKGDCDDRMGGICPRLAEARAGAVLAERQLIEFNHRLANVLQMVVTLIGRQRRRMRDDRIAQDELDSLAARVHAAAALHRYLLPPRTHGDVDLGALIEDVAVAIEGVTGLVCVVDSEPVHVPGQVAMHLATVVNELAWNAHKHAYRDAQGGVIRIVCRRDADRRLRLSVADRGCGLPADFDPHASEGFGLMIVCATARQFGGDVQVESEQGTRFTLLLNIPRA
jgi:two-component sensor histidine kinase